MLTGPDDSDVLNRVVVAVAAAVALHCLIAPLLSDRLPALTGETAHLVLALAATVLSGIAVVRGWLRHLEGRVFGWAVGAWTFLFLARMGGAKELGEVGEILLTCAGVLLLIMAHQINRSLTYWNGKE